MRKLWITQTTYPASEIVRAEAANAGAVEIVHDIPPALADLIEPGTFGYVELDDPVIPDEPLNVSPEERIADLESQLAATATILAELLDLLGGQ